MNNLIKKFGVFAFIAIFVFSMIACCCLTQQAEANADVPACHQTEHQKGSSQHADNCGCEHLSKKAVAKNTALAVVSFQLFHLNIVDPLSALMSSVTIDLAAYQAPPNIQTEIPLYIQHSVYRL